MLTALYGFCWSWTITFSVFNFNCKFAAVFEKIMKLNELDHCCIFESWRKHSYSNCSRRYLNKSLHIDTRCNPRTEVLFYTGSGKLESTKKTRGDRRRRKETEIRGDKYILYFPHQSRRVFFSAEHPPIITIWIAVLITTSTCVNWQENYPQPLPLSLSPSLSLSSLLLSPRRFQPLPHDRRGAQQLGPRLPGHAARLLVLPALPAAVARRHRHPPHLGRPPQHQHHQPHQQAGQIRLRGSHQGRWAGWHSRRVDAKHTLLHSLTRINWWHTHTLTHTHTHKSVSSAVPLPAVSVVIKYTSYRMTLTVTPPPVMHWHSPAV